MKKQDDKPRCYGVSYTKDYLCKKCPFKRACESVCSFWNDKLSLTEHLKILEDELLVKVYSDIPNLYCRLHEKHFGRLPSKKSIETRMAVNTFVRLRKFCKKTGADPITFVTAQMHGMKSLLKDNEQMSFQPTMLSGKNAVKRYNIYISIAARRQRTLSDTLDSETTLDKLLSMLTLNEEIVAEYYVASILIGEAIDWDDAIDEVEPDDDWVAINSELVNLNKEGKILRFKLARIYSSDLLSRCKSVAQLRAAIAIAGKYVAGLPHLIGYNKEFFWEAYASFLKRILGDRVKKRTTNKEFEGAHVLWGNL